MKYILQVFETLINNTLHPSNSNLNSYTVLQLQDFINQAANYNTQLRNDFIQLIFSFKKEEQIELFIQLHQAALIRLSNDVLSHLNTTKKQAKTEKQLVTLKDVYKVLLHYLQETLTFIEKHFSKYFDITQPIPNAYKSLMNREIKTWLRFIQHNKIVNHTNDELFLVIIKPLQNFINPKINKVYSYRYIIYLKLAMKEFDSLLDKDDLSQIKQQLTDKLIYLNFNSVYTSSYIISAIAKEVSNNQNQIDTLTQWNHKISRAIIKPSVALKSKLPSLQEQLVWWLQDEIMFLNRKQQMALVMPISDATKLNENNATVTALSVKQLGLFIRLLMDTKLIACSNQTELLQRIAAIVKTTNTNTISPQSLRQHYYAIEESSKSIIKNWLFKMIDQLRKY